MSILEEVMSHETKEKLKIIKTAMNDLQYLEENPNFSPSYVDNILDDIIKNLINAREV